MLHCILSEWHRAMTDSLYTWSMNGFWHVKCEGMLERGATKVFVTHFLNSSTVYHLFLKLSCIIFFSKILKWNLLSSSKKSKNLTSDKVSASQANIWWVLSYLCPLLHIDSVACGSFVALMLGSGISHAKFRFYIAYFLTGIGQWLIAYIPGVWMFLTCEA